MKRNARLSGMVVVLVLVILALLYFQRTVNPPPPAPGLENVPPLGQVPSREHIENRAPDTPR